MQLDWPILSVLVWLPIAAGVLLLLVGDRNAAIGRWLALAASLATFAISVLLWREFDPATASMQFFEQRARVLAIGERMDGVLERRGPDRLQTPPDLHPQIGRLSRKLRDQEQPRGSLCVCHSCIVTSLQV